MVLVLLFNCFILIYSHSTNSTSHHLDWLDIPTSNDMNTEITNNGILGLWGRLQTIGPKSMGIMDFLLFGCLILVGLEFLNFLVMQTGMWAKLSLIPVRGKHLDDLSQKDHLYISINKAATPPFVYFLFSYLYYEPNSVWDLSHITVSNTLLPIPVLFIVYDFFYTILHWALHIKCVYGYIHIHHHHQLAPSRANVDAVNVHPLEFFLGEYNHLLAVYIYARLLGLELHAVTLLLFLVIGGALASLNHTRYDFVISIFGITIYDSKYHDVHHRIPRSNYGQYIMLWDHVLFESFRDYNKDDRVNPKHQLDSETGKSLRHESVKKID